MKFLKSLYVKFGLMVFGLLLAVQSKAAEGDLVNIDTTKVGLEQIVFTPGALIMPIVKIVAACIMGAAALWLVIIGIKWLLKFAKGR